MKSLKFLNCKCINLYCWRQLLYERISQFLPFDMNYETSFPLEEICYIIWLQMLALYIFCRVQSITSLPHWSLWICQILKTCSNLSNLVYNCPNLFKLVQTCSYLFILVQTCSNLFKLVQTCSNLFKLDQNGSNWFKLDLDWSNLIKLVWTWSKLIKLVQIGSKGIKLV